MLSKQFTPETSRLIRKYAEAAKYKHTEIQDKNNIHELLKLS